MGRCSRTHEIPETGFGSRVRPDRWVSPGGGVSGSLCQSKTNLYYSIIFKVPFAGISSVVRFFHMSRRQISASFPDVGLRD